jgi:NADH-quinone oxidoreductase subunit L
MTIPLLILVVPSIISGLWGSPFLSNPFGLFLEGHPTPVDFRPDTAVISTVLALVGIGIAWSMYGGGKLAAGASMTARFRPIYEMLIQRYYVDHFYNWIVSRVVLGIGWVADRFDALVVDGAVNGVGAAAIALGTELRRVQTGQVQTYAWVLFAGAVTLALLVAAPIFFGGRG